MARTTTTKARRKVKPQSTKGQPAKETSGTKVKRPGAKTRKLSGGKAPLEHTHGQSNWGQRDGQPSSLEEETLDPAAPYNKTYGRIRKSK